MMFCFQVLLSISNCGATVRYQELTHSAMTPRAKTELEKLEFDIWPIARRGL
jgi:hypothetical protein